MINLPITLNPATFPNGYCPTSYQNLANDIALGMNAYVDGAYTVWNYGSAEPAPEDRLKPWLRTLADGTPDRPFIFSGGAWIWPHEVPPSSSELRMWKGLEADLDTYDGGATGTVTDRTGPMWQVDHDYDCRFPVGAGTFPSPSTTILTVGATGGEETHSLTAAEIPPHSHTLALTKSAQAGQDNNGAPVPNSGFPNIGGWPSQVSTSSVGGNGATPNVVTPHNNMPPYKAVFFIRRTARVYRTPQ